MAIGHENTKKKVQLLWTQTKRGRLFPNNTGSAWRGKIADEKVIDGVREITLYFANLLHYGLGKGSSDLIGFEWIDGVPVFASVEIKTKGYKRVSKDQKDWLDMMKMHGCRCYVYIEIDGELMEERI